MENATFRPTEMTCNVERGGRGSVTEVVPLGQLERDKDEARQMTNGLWLARLEIGDVDIF